jgi:alpha-1,3-rhamnosyltransferase
VRAGDLKFLTAREKKYPSVAVFVPSYNHASFIEPCLTSIFEQTLRPSRLLVIDDGSTDGSPDIIRRLLSSCPFPSELVVRENCGLSATLNECLRRTDEPIVTYIASDDRWHPGRLEAAVDTLAANPAAVMTFGPFFTIDHRDRVTGASVFHTKEGTRLFFSFVRKWKCTFDSLFQFRTVPLAVTVTFRRSAVEQFYWNENSHLEDYEMYLLLASIGDICYSEGSVGYWREHEGQVSNRLEDNLAEVIETQRRVARRLNVSSASLCRSESSARYVYGEYFLRQGDWVRGVRLTVRNIRSTPSSSAFLERAARIALAGMAAMRPSSRDKTSPA